MTCGRGQEDLGKGEASAQHIEDDIDAALRVGVDYITPDDPAAPARAPVIYRDAISAPINLSLARARCHLDARGNRGVMLIITGRLRVPTDFGKAPALGPDAVVVSNAAMRAIG